MPRKIIKRYMPHPDTVKEHKFLKVFGQLIHDPQLWHLTRYSVARAFVIGLFTAFMPIPFQMIMAATLALIFHANIALSVALVWISNPFTMPFMFGLAYFVGVWALGIEQGEFNFELSTQWLTDNFAQFWEPLLLGCFICGTIAATLGYIGIRIFWRLHIASAWRKRAERRQQRRDSDDKG